MRKNSLLLTTITLLSFSSAFAQEHEKEKKDTVNDLQQVEIFGDRNKNQRGLETITRFPGSPQDQLQSISIISEKLIEDQGALTITEAARNVPGVTLFGSYGGNRESMSIRGYRGTPVLKNGIRMDSDFRTSSGVVDMQGVESLQVIRGAAAITQGMANGLGSAGGVINVITKTPRYTNSGNIGLRVGSWNQIRTTFDVQRVVGQNKNFAVRLNGAYEQADSYRDVINKNRIYINPSIAWKIDDKTEFVAEFDYFNGEATPDRGTFNTKGITENGLVDFGSRFLGFDIDNEETNTFSYSARITRQLTDKINVRAAWMSNFNERDQTASTLTGSGLTRSRGIGRSFKDDRNSTLQIDVMGKDFTFGKFKWSWQVGYDISTTRTDARTASGITTKELQEAGYDQSIYTVNSTGAINNHINLTDALNQKLELGASTMENMTSYGFLTQQRFSYADFVTLVAAARYSYANDYKDSAIDPMVGLMITPFKDINANIYGTYATTTSLRSASRTMLDGTTSGASVTDQFEAGIKTSWFNDRFRANVNYFNMNEDNLTYQYYDPNTNQATNFYDYAGNLRRSGFEAEITGRPLSNVQVLLGYSYTDVGYRNSPAFVEGSRPMNSPYSTANAWAQYKFQNTHSIVDGLGISLGVYYVGSRPVNDRATSRDSHGNLNNGQAPFLMPEMTTLNAQLSYTLKRFDFRLFFNNITDEIGYNSYYRGGYINQIDPFNMAGQIVFKF
ncbi:TonB-dependent receptor [Algoriella sp.]|uniref:TonB-dependent siderophore receptor n=1 Tax=Algoriella sp. TaxID=1872434 RepID=UPI001B17A00F|nr:TonB-dependent receptor [Algoriella sp.]MBO6213114.1 TonB-dependent receptor [Algoriella sp.]